MTVLELYIFLLFPWSAFSGKKLVFTRDVLKQLLSFPFLRLIMNNLFP